MKLTCIWHRIAILKMKQYSQLSLNLIFQYKVRSYRKPHTFAGYWWKFYSQLSLNAISEVTGNFFFSIFLLGFFHTFNYNIENWVWTRTLAAPCCLLSGLASSLEDIDLLVWLNTYTLTLFLNIDDHTHVQPRVYSSLGPVSLIIK